MRESSGCYLIQGRLVNIPDKDGNTPLLWAARRDSKEIVRLLLDTGEAKVNIQDKDRKTPLLLAVRSGREETVRLLLDTGEAGINTPDINGRTPLSWAADNVHVPIVELLLSTGRARMGTRYSQMHYYLLEQREDLDHIEQLLKQQNRSATWISALWTRPTKLWSFCERGTKDCERATNG